MSAAKLFVLFHYLRIFMQFECHLQCRRCLLEEGAFWKKVPSGRRCLLEEGAFWKKVPSGRRCRRTRAHARARNYYSQYYTNHTMHATTMRTTHTTICSTMHTTICTTMHTTICRTVSTGWSRKTARARTRARAQNYSRSSEKSVTHCTYHFEILKISHTR